MSASRYPRWAPPAAFVGFLAIAILLSNRTASIPGVGEVILNDAEYNDAKAKMEDLSLARVDSFEAGQPLSKDDFEKLREASKLLDKMDAYKPEYATTFYLSGKIHHILGEDQIAVERFRQSLYNVPLDVAERKAIAGQIYDMSADANYHLSLLLLQQHDLKGAFEAADAAVKGVPSTSLERGRRLSVYLTARASAENELRQLPAAKADLIQATKLDPMNRQASSLLRFVLEQLAGPSQKAG